MTKPFTPKKLLRDFYKDYTEAKTLDAKSKILDGYAAALRDWKMTPSPEFRTSPKLDRFYAKHRELEPSKRGAAARIKIKEILTTGIEDHIAALTNKRLF